MTSSARRFCASLGISHPIVQSGMSRVAGPEVVRNIADEADRIIREL
jgi:NAD(P)H-dependent flavin oxidoreductase YrpB (nitropropane dioxygenase family)